MAFILFACAVAILTSMIFLAILVLKELLTKKYSLKKILTLYFGIVVMIAASWHWGAIVLFWSITVLMGFMLENDKENCSRELTQEEYKIID